MRRLPVARKRSVSLLSSAPRSTGFKARQHTCAQSVTTRSVTRTVFGKRDPGSKGPSTRQVFELKKPSCLSRRPTFAWGRQTWSSRKSNAAGGRPFLLPLCLRCPVFWVVLTSFFRRTLEDVLSSSGREESGGRGESNGRGQGMRALACS